LIWEHQWETAPSKQSNRQQGLYHVNNKDKSRTKTKKKKKKKKKQTGVKQPIEKMGIM
jgi:hypothetical protein